MSILVVTPEKELKIKSDSFQTNRTKIVHRTEEITIVCFRLKGTPIIIDQISRDKLLQPNKRYALIGNCLEEGKRGNVATVATVATVWSFSYTERFISATSRRLYSRRH